MSEVEGTQKRDKSGVRQTDVDFELSLEDVVLLLEREIERLKAALETYRLLDHPQKVDIIRWHVRRLDERQDRLDELRDALSARRGIH